MEITIKKSHQGNDTLVYKKYGKEYWGIDNILPVILSNIDFDTRRLLTKLRFMARELPSSKFKDKILEKLELKNIINYFPHNFPLLRAYLGDEVAKIICDLKNNNISDVINRFLSSNPEYRKIKKEEYGEAIGLSSHGLDEIVIKDNHIVCGLKIKGVQVDVYSLDRHI